MAAIGLQSQIWNNNFKSILLLGFYPFLILAMFWAISFLWGWGFVAGNTGNTELAVQSGISVAHGFSYRYWPLIFTVVAIWFLIAYFLQGKMIRAMSHAHSVSRAEEPELYNMLENLCISRGLKTPKLQIIETHARNAFASGIDDKTYTVTLTRGLLQSLEPDEVEAVIAHEVSHILNRDVRLLIVSIIFTGMIGFLAQMAWSTVRYNIYMPRRRDKGSGKAIIVFLAIAAILWIGYMATLFTRFALSRRREYMADAGAVSLTKNPEAMMRALMRLSGKDSIPKMPDDVALMCIENSRKFLGMFATHPPMEARIKAISQITDTPIPDITTGHRTEDQTRFKKPEERRNPWLTATRHGRNPWDNS